MYQQTNFLSLMENKTIARLKTKFFCKRFSIKQIILVMQIIDLIKSSPLLASSIVIFVSLSRFQKYHNRRDTSIINDSELAFFIHGFDIIVGEPAYIFSRDVVLLKLCQRRKKVVT